MGNLAGSLSHKGTESYMAPEVFSASNYDSRVDIYSLGIVLYKLLNDNCNPFLTQDTRTSPVERETALRKRVQGVKMPTPQNASSNMAKIILKACEHDPAKRYYSATEMRRDLETMNPGGVSPIRKINWLMALGIGR